MKFLFFLLAIMASAPVVVSFDGLNEVAGEHGYVLAGYSSPEGEWFACLLPMGETQADEKTCAGREWPAQRIEKPHGYVVAVGDLVQFLLVLRGE